MKNAGRRAAESSPAPVVRRTAVTDPRVSCVLCTTPRTGSWLLSEGLLATGLAGRPEEYLRPDWLAWYRERGRLEYEHRLDFWPGVGSDPPPERPALDPRDFRRFLAAVRDVGTVNGVFAVKVHRNQLDLVLDQLRQVEPAISDLDLLTWWLPGPRYVFLQRRDPVRRAVSHYRAVRSGVWWRYSDGHSGSRARDRIGDPPVDPRAIHEIVRRGAAQELAWLDFFHRAGVEPLVVTYEDLVLDLPGRVGDVLRHLGIPEPAVAPAQPSRLTRQADAWTDRAVQEYVSWARINVPGEEWRYGYDVSE